MKCRSVLQCCYSKRVAKEFWILLHTVLMTVWSLLLCTPPLRLSMLFIGLDNPQNWPFLWDLHPHLIHGSLGSPESATQAESWSVQSFSQGTSMWPTDRQTDHTMCNICSSRPHLMHCVHAMWPNNIIHLLCFIMLMIVTELAVLRMYCNAAGWLEFLSQWTSNRYCSHHIWCSTSGYYGTR